MRRNLWSSSPGCAVENAAVTYPAEALHVCDYCFGPLEVTYDYEAVKAHISRQSIAAGPQTIWRYAPLLPVYDPAPSTSAPGCTPARAGRSPGGRARTR